MCNPPTLNNASKETVDEYNAEVKALFDSLKSRAEIVTLALNKMTNVVC